MSSRFRRTMLVAHSLQIWATLHDSSSMHDAVNGQTSMVWEHFCPRHITIGKTSSTDQWGFLFPGSFEKTSYSRLQKMPTGWQLPFWAGCGVKCMWIDPSFCHPTRILESLFLDADTPAIFPSLDCPHFSLSLIYKKGEFFFWHSPKVI